VLATNALYVLRSDAGVSYCVLCWAAAAHVAPEGMNELVTLARSFIDADDPKAQEKGKCGRCGTLGLVVTATDRRPARTRKRRNS
jgi:hypothetical protein